MRRRTGPGLSAQIVRVRRRCLFRGGHPPAPGKRDPTTCRFRTRVVRSRPGRRVDLPRGRPPPHREARRARLLRPLRRVVPWPRESVFVHYHASRAKCEAARRPRALRLVVARARRLLGEFLHVAPRERKRGPTRALARVVRPRPRVLVPPEALAPAPPAQADRRARLLAPRRVVARSGGLFCASTRGTPVSERLER